MKTICTTMTLLLLAGAAARADKLKFENVSVKPRDAKTATVTFDIAWSNAWRRGSFHDAVWVFFKARAEDKSGWQHVRLAADKVVNPTGFATGEGTPLEFIVPDGKDGFVGMFVRLAKNGSSTVEASGVTALLDLTKLDTRRPTSDTLSIRVFGIEMVYVAEGLFCLGSGGTERNRFYKYTDGSQDQQPYWVTSAGAIPTGRQEGKLWAKGIAPEDGGGIPAPFPNGHSAFYCMKYPYIARGQYAGFLNTLTPPQAKERYYTGGHGHWIKRSGKSPDYTYSASAPDERCPWLSWADGAAFAAWAGLRPMTELEYEKAIRGPQDPAPNDATPSYWGVADVNRGGIYERPVSAGSAAGRKFAGTHGRGMPEALADWPTDVGGIVIRSGYTEPHLRTSGRSNVVAASANRSIHPFAGWRAARSAPAGDTAMGPITGRPDPRTVRPVARLGRGVRADGVLDEWVKSSLTLDGAEDVFPVYRRFAPFDYYRRLLKPWEGPADISAKVYLGCDGKALCVAAEVTDDRHLNTKTGDSISSGDALQMGLVTAEGVHWNIALALTRTGAALHQFAGQRDTLVKTADCAVARDDKARVTRYELRLPVAVLGLKPGAEFGFNIVFVDDDDGNGQPYWLQLAPGLTQPVNSKLYPRFVLAK